MTSYRHEETTGRPLPGPWFRVGDKVVVQRGNANHEGTVTRVIRKSMDRNKTSQSAVEVVLRSDYQNWYRSAFFEIHFHPATETRKAYIKTDLRLLEKT